MVETVGSSVAETPERIGDNVEGNRGGVEIDVEWLEWVESSVF